MNTTTTTATAAGIGAPTTGTAPEISSAPPTYNTSEPVSENYAPHEKAPVTPDDNPHPNGPQNGPGFVMVIPLTALGREEAIVDCPRCQRAVKTKLYHSVGNRASIWSAIICLCFGCLCAWIPCVMTDCKDAEHYCSSCELMLANVTPGGAVELSQRARATMAEHSRHQPQSEQYAAASAMEAGQAQQQQPEVARQRSGTADGQVATGTVNGAQVAK